MTVLEKLAAFAAANKFTTRGAMNVGLVMSRRARDAGLPLAPEQQLSDSGSQVRGLNGAAGNSILADHGVPYRFGTESGRTNRGAPKQMRQYVEFLNSLAGEPDFGIEPVEAYWVEQIVAFFENKPFRLRREVGASLQSVIADLLAQARERQKGSGGAMIIGTVMQHLVGAKLEAALAGRVPVEHHGANISDQAGRGGDFDIGDTAIHVTASPGELLIEKCRANLDQGLRPLIVTTARGVAAASELADQRGLGGRVELHTIEQFLALNILELGAFRASDAMASLRDVVDRYNAIVERHETNPSLRIEWS